MSEKAKDVLRETDDEAIRLAKTLSRSARYGALAVLDPAGGAPMASRVAVATDLDGAPLILVSALSGHTGGLVADPRCSLLLGEPGKGDPLAHPRISIACRAEKIARDDARHARIERRFLNRHPKAKLYSGFADFSFFRLQPTGASLNGGFGKAYALGAADLLTSGPASEELADAEQGALDHMNSDHLDAIGVYARSYAGAETGKWVLTGLDADGMDIACGDETRRIFFPEPLTQARELRHVLVDMAKQGRANLAS
ncbi:HugZ family protein [Aquamicrobium sp. LC103]|nr:HugZ family protein [Aquamicrobium sp. LC103]